MTSKQTKSPPTTQQTLLDIWCIIHGWDEIIINALNAHNISSVVQLKSADLSTITESIDWTQCSQPKCICNETLFGIVAQECYPEQSVSCDGCGESVEQTKNVYHCKNDKSKKHPDGYDLCTKCTVINTKDRFIKKVHTLISAQTVDIKYPQSKPSYYGHSKGARFKGQKGGGGGMLRNKSMKKKKMKSRSMAMPKRAMKSKKSSERMGPKKIGFSVGGAKDVNSFRDNILKNERIPQLNSISFEGIYYDYYFETEDHEEDETLTEKKMDVDVDDDDDDDKENENKQDLAMFYPNYTYSKSYVPDSLLMLRSDNVTKRTNDMIDDDDDDNDGDDVYDFHLDEITKGNGEFEYFLSVGLGSNINEEDFKRNHLNLICVLDVSGSMGSTFGGGAKSKMKIANECVLSILTHLTHKDRFGLVLFDTSGWKQIKFRSMKRHKLNELESILQIYENGGTNFESGWNKAIEMFDDALKNDSVSDFLGDYENRIIFLTDACPNIGVTDPNSLMGMVKKAATKKSRKKRIYTTFVGVGLDFNANLISEITKVRGANYFAVHSEKEFYQKLSLEFDYFVSPMVFNLRLSLQCEGGEVCIDAVYGSNDIDVHSGEIMKINTLFPSPPDDEGDVKGGIVLIKLKNARDIKGNIFVECSFEDKLGKKFSDKQNVELVSQNDNDEEFYDNLGARKGILLTRYVILMKEWIKKCGERSSLKSTSSEWKQIFKTFKSYFQNEMRSCSDDTLKQEIKILTKLINSK